MKSSPRQSEVKECSAKPSAVQAPPDDPPKYRETPDGAAFLHAACERPGISIYGLYLHIPFCFHKCHYCDFYSIVDERDRQSAFTERLIEETRAVADIVPSCPRTIFVGGGTPTLLKPDLWRRLLDALHESFDLSRLTEFTVEANPETVTTDLLDTLAGGEVNRISIGAQSFNPVHLKTLERWHDPANVERAVLLARAAGLQNVNLDLIFAIPGESLEDWREDLHRALDLAPTHLSCYSLMYEPNTPLTRKLELGRIAEADEELEATMFEHTIDTLTAAGFEHYEVSNFAQPGKSCEHNLIYWRNENWLALGPSASGHIAGTRWKNVPHLGRYLASSGAAPVQDVERLDEHASIGEQLMLRLRLIDGVENEWLARSLNQERRDLLNAYTAQGYIETAGEHTRLTRRGLMLADSILGELL